MTALTSIQADITALPVDAIVNAADRRVRGGGGVDGAIHRAGGPDILADCIARFPHGLATGDAGATTAGRLRARWVIHAVGPNHRAGERDPELLASCYRRALAVADELGARSVAFPLISAGVYGWPREDAVEIAVRTLANTRTDAEELTIVAFDEDADRTVRRSLSFHAALRLLEGVSVVHERGYQSIRALPYMSPSGAYWRLEIFEESDAPPAPDAPRIGYSTSSGPRFADIDFSPTTSPEEVADAILRMLPGAAAAPDPEYARWYAGLLDLVHEHARLPVAFGDDYVPKPGWQIGWGSDVRYPDPPRIPGCG